MTGARFSPRAVIATSLCLALAFLHTGSAAARVRGGEPVVITTKPVAVGPVPVGSALQFLGALDLHSPDKRFGGLSSLRWQDGWLHALSDENGAWYAFRVRERGERLVGIGQARTITLLDSDGAPLLGKRRSDAESMDFVLSACGRPECPPDAVLVGLERDHRILQYPLNGGLPTGRPERLGGISAWLADQPENLGVESLAADERGTLLISEGKRASDGGASALFISPRLGTAPIRPGSVRDVSVPAPGEMRPSDLVGLGHGRFILLRRSWSEAAGFAVVVEELTLDESADVPVATTRVLLNLVPPIISENFEGVALHRVHGRTYLYIIADDNFDAHQRTLLLKFRLREGS